MFTVLFCDGSAPPCGSIIIPARTSLPVTDVMQEVGLGCRYKNRHLNVPKDKPELFIYL